MYDFSAGKNINNNKHWEIMNESDFINDKVNSSDVIASECEPLYDEYFEEIKHLIKDDVEVKNKLDSIENSNDDCVMLNNVVLNFDPVIGDKSSWVGSNNLNEEDYKALVKDSNNKLHKDQENEVEAILPADNFVIQDDTYSCMTRTNDVLQNDPQDKNVMSECILKDLNNKNTLLMTLDNHNNFIQAVNNEEAHQSQRDSNKELIDQKIPLDNNSNYNHVENSNSSKISDCYNSGDIVIIDSNPRVLSEFEYVNKSEMVNDFDIVNSCSSQSPNSNNEIKSPYENFEVVGNDDNNSEECTEEERAANRLFKENLQRAKRTKELAEEEHKQKLSIRENAREYINIFNK